MAAKVLRPSRVSRDDDAATVSVEPVAKRFVDRRVVHPEGRETPAAGFEAKAILEQAAFAIATGSCSIGPSVRILPDGAEPPVQAPANGIPRQPARLLVGTFMPCVAGDRRKARYERSRS